MKSRYGYQTPIASVTSAKGQTKELSYKDGVNTYKDNDDVQPTELIAAIDARFKSIGRYKTRKGADRYSVPIGEAVNVQNTSTSGASDAEVTATKGIAQKLTAASTNRVTRVDVRIKKDSDASGTVRVLIYDDDSGTPGELLGDSSIAASAITTSYAYLPCYFIAAPDVTNAGIYWVVVIGQESVSGSYYVSTTTAATTALVSTDSGASWSSTSYSANVKLYTSTTGPVKGLYRAYRSNGSKLTVFAHGTSIYSVDDGTGATTTIKSGLNSSATYYRFQLVQDTLYWVNGYEKPYQYDFSTASEITASPYIPSLIMEHKGLLFYVDTVDTTRLFFTNFADYDAFTSTDFIYVPAPKSYDKLTALAKLNGALFIFANRNKFLLLGSDDSTFSLDEAASQKGTFTQESLVFDHDNIYFASDDGIYEFNGTYEKNIALPFLEDYMAIPNKEDIKLELHNNRLYIFHTPVGGGENSQCWVHNTLLGKYEGLDTGTYVDRTFGRYAQEDIFVQGSNRVGALYWGELDTNDYHNLGSQLQYELRTSYGHFDAPGQFKRAPMWRPVFAAQESNYNVECGYAFDFSEDVTYQNVNVGTPGYRYDTGLTYDSGLHYVVPTNVSPTSLTVPGEWKRLQRRYRHIAAREPVEFDSEVLSIQTQRLR